MAWGVSGEGQGGAEWCRDGTDNSPRGGGGVQPPAGYRLLLSPPWAGASRHRQAYKSTPGGVGCPGCPHQLLGGSGTHQRDLCLCWHMSKKEMLEDAGLPALWVVRVWPGKRPPTAILFCYKQPTLRSPLHPTQLSVLLRSALAEVGTIITSCKWGQ